MQPGSFICREHFTKDKLHFCDEWDFLLINKYGPEIASCLCFKTAQKKRVIVGKLSDQQTRSGKSHPVLDGGFEEAINDGVIPDTPIPRPPK